MSLFFLSHTKSISSLSLLLSNFGHFTKTFLFIQNWFLCIHLWMFSEFILTGTLLDPTLKLWRSPCFVGIFYGSTPRASSARPVPTWVARRLRVQVRPVVVRTMVKLWHVPPITSSGQLDYRVKFWENGKNFFASDFYKFSNSSHSNPFVVMLIICEKSSALSVVFKDTHTCTHLWKMFCVTAASLFFLVW